MTPFILTVCIDREVGVNLKIPCEDKRGGKGKGKLKEYSPSDSTKLLPLKWVEKQKEIV